MLPDTRAGRRQLTTLIQRWFAQGVEQLYCGVESTGGYENNWYQHVCSLAHTAAIQVARLNPKPVKAYGEAGMVRTQTDAVSAFHIACYLIDWPTKIRYSPSNESREDPRWQASRAQVRLVQMLTKQRTQLTNQLEKLLYGQLSELVVYCRHGMPEWLVCLLSHYASRAALVQAGAEGIARINGLSRAKAARQIHHLHTQIHQEWDFLIQRFQDHPEVQLLTTIPGVGLASAGRLIVEIEQIARFETVKQLGAYFGVHPTWKQSGDGIWYRGMSKQGRPAVRATLFMCALTTIRCNPDLKRL